MSFMHPEQSALWETIRDHPHDDAPRLIYADWLEEHDDADRAEFIRLQIALSGPASTLRRDASLSQKKARVYELMANNRRIWWRPLHKFLDDTGFSRGFPSPRFDSRHYRFFNQLARYYQWVIPEWNLTMESSVKSLMEIAVLDCFRLAVSLELISDIPNPAILKPFMNTPNLANIWRLTLGMDRIRTGHLEVMIDSPLPGQLRQFSIQRESAINFSHLKQAIGGTTFPNLIRLDLMNQFLINDVIWQLDEIIPLQKLRYLNLSHNMIGSDGLRCISHARETSLETLDLASNHLDEESAILLANSPMLANLVHLDLSFNQINQTGLIALLESPYRSDWLTFKLDGNPGWESEEISSAFNLINEKAAELDL